MSSLSKKILLSGLVVTSILALASCSKEFRNQEVPYGNISDSVVAKAGNYTVTEKELYNRLKYTKGSSLLSKEINNILYKDEIAKVNYNEHKEDIDLAIANDIFGTMTVTDLEKKLKKTNANSGDGNTPDYSKEYYDSIDSYIKRKGNEGISGLERTDFEAEIKINEFGEKVFSFKKLPEELINDYKLEVAKEIAAKEYIEEVKDQEYFTETNDDGKEIQKENQFYVDDEAIEKYFNSYYSEYYTAHGIVLRFDSKKQAEDAINRATSNQGINDSNYQQAYTSLFNNYYAYKGVSLKNNFENIETLHETTFVKNIDYDQLASYSSSISTLFLDNLGCEDKNGEMTKSYLTTPISIEGNYYLVYRHDVEYLASGSSEKVDYDEASKLPNWNTVKAEVERLYKDSLVSAAKTEVESKRIEDYELKIYDPFLEYNYASTNTSYEFVKEGSKDTIFTIKTSENADIQKYTVDEFKNDLFSYNTTDEVVNLLLNDLMYATEKDYLDEDREKDYRNEIKDNVKNFKKGNATLPNLYSEENYLFYTYGYTTQEEVVVNNLASEILSAYLGDYIYNSWATDDHKINPALNEGGILQNIIDTAMLNYNNAETNPFEINIDHILISVDANGDGQPDDAELFYNSLSDDQKKVFEEDLTNLSKAIAKEVEAIKGHTTFEKLSHIAEAFERGDKNAEGKSWDEYKTHFNFILKAEQLGESTQDTVSNYVLPFKKYIEDMFAKAVEDNLQIPEDEENQGRLYAPTKGELTSTNLEFNDLCFTEFGFHIVSLNSYEDTKKSVNFKFTSDMANAGDYAEIKVTLDEKDPDDKDDDIYIITDIFNDNAEKPSVNQAFVYYVEYMQGDVTSIKTSLENSLSLVLDPVLEKYKSSEFQKYLVVNKLGTVEVTNLDSFDLDAYKNDLKDTVCGDQEDIYGSWFNPDMNWDR